MNIVHIVLNSVGKGTYWRALHFGRHLVQQGHTVTLLATAPTNRWGMNTREIDGVRLVETPDLLPGSLRSGWDLWNSAQRTRWLGRQPFDLVHAFEARPTVILPTLYLKRWRDVPLVMDWADWFGRGGSVEERSNPIMRMLLRPVETFFEEAFRTQADATTVICSVLQEKAIRLGVDPGSILHLPNGCTPVPFQQLPVSEVRGQLGLPSDGIYIGYIGSIFAEDAALLAQAFDHVYQQEPAARLLLIGCPPLIRQLVQTPTNVHETGWIPNAQVHEYLQVCDLCWLPLRNRAANRGRWPLKLGDYLATGLPTVATPVGDVATLFAEEAVGVLAADEPVAFAEATLRLMADPARRAALGQQARTVALTRFRWTTLTERLCKHYEWAIRRHTANA